MPSVNNRVKGDNFSNFDMPRINVKTCFIIFLVVLVHKHFFRSLNIEFTARNLVPAPVWHELNLKSITYINIAEFYSP